MSQSPKPSGESTHKEWIARLQLEALPDAIVAWDWAGKILSLNAAARTLFEVQAPDSWEGMPAQQFFQHYTWYDEQHRPFFFAPWLQKLAVPGEEVASCSSQQTLVLALPSRRKVLLELHWAPVLDAEMQQIGLLAVFHEVALCYQKALHIQRVYEALVCLNEAIVRLPERLPVAYSDETLLFSPPALLVAQQLVDVIRQVLACWRVSLSAFSLPPLHISYVVGSGFTAEQEQRLWKLRFLFTDFVDETVLTRLQANQEVIVTTDHIRIPTGFSVEFGVATLLALPLFLEQNLAGLLLIHKQGWESGYTQEEIDLVKAVAAQALLLLDYLGSLQNSVGEQARDLVLPEVDRLSKDFLTLASHELRTPLTGIKGNLQVAQRRLERFKRSLDQQSESMSEHLEQTQQSLASAGQSVRLQERMVQDVIDGMRIQADQLDLLLKPCELLDLLKQAVAKQHQSVPGRPIELEMLTPRPTIPILADARRIIQVLTIYLANAFDSSPAERPVTVRVQEEDAFARVSVHDEGPGIPLEEQVRLWDSSYRGKGSAVQQELDLRFGFSFYLCQVLIERHHGTVGMQSSSGQGTTFWLTLPIARPPGA